MGILLQNGTVTESDYNECMRKFEEAFKAKMKTEDLTAGIY